MAMARDGLLPSFFSDINKHTRVPVKSTLVTGIFIAVLAFLMDVSQLTGMVSVGTLLAFTIVAISVLILRYIPPAEVPLSSQTQQSFDSVLPKHSTNTQEIDGESAIQSVGPRNSRAQQLIHDGDNIAKYPLLHKEVSQGSQYELRRRKIATWSITLACVGVLVLVSAASAEGLPIGPRLMISGVGGLLLLCCLVVLTCTDQADARHNFGYSGGFLCPFVPFLPLTCILINTYLLINLGAGTWMRVSIWLAIGVLIYVTYGRKHSLLNKNDA